MRWRSSGHAATAATDVDVKERGVGEARHPCKESRTFYQEALDVGAVDVGDAKVERPSLRVACFQLTALGNRG